MATKKAPSPTPSRQPGYFRLAAGGTILLDEISEIQPHLQAKLLRVIEDKHFMPVGGQKLIPVRASIIATSNVDLEKAVEQGRFRRDLFYRLCEMPLQLPSLCDRKEDVALLAHYFLFNYCGQFHRPFKTLSPIEIAILENHTWPGNVRELENYMKQTALLGRFVGPKKSATQSEMKSGNFLQTVGLPDEIFEEKVSLTDLTKKLTSHVERTIIYRALEACNQNRTRAADRLGISYRTLLRKLDQHQAKEVADLRAHPN